MIDIKDHNLLLRPPHLFKRRVLLATLGLSPAVLTETIYALACLQSPAFVPNEIHIITTTEGKHRAQLSLLDPSMAKLKLLAESFELDDLNGALSIENIHLIKRPNGASLSDISSVDDNFIAADAISQLVQKLTSDSDTALHVSIAGGRKTMGFLLGYALSIYGRQQDRLSHVLVDEPFDTLPDFFFPPLMPIVLIDRSGRPVSTADAKIKLADIPFIRLRQGMPAAMLSGAKTYSDTVEAAQAALAAPTLTFKHETCSIICGKQVIALKPMVFAVFAWLARRTKEMGSQEAGFAAKTLDGDMLAAIRDEYELIPKSLRPPASRILSLSQSSRQIDSTFIVENFSRLRSILAGSLGQAAVHYTPQAVPKKPHRNYQLLLPTEAILFC